MAVIGAVLLGGCGGGGSQDLSTCGNARIDTGERCDDGNQNDRDGCTTACQVAQCGDGVVYAGTEDCDGRDLNGGSCAPQGLQGIPVCDAACRYDYSACGPPLIPTSTPLPTSTPAPPTATPTATPGSRCGDGLLSSDETCESCPADCTPQACDPDGATTAVPVTLSLPSGALPGQVRLLLAYRTSVVSLPSTGLQARFAADQTGLILRPIAKQYAVDVAAARTGGVADGLLFTVTFDRCAGAPPPTGSDFACTVVNCSTLSGCTCAVEAP
jgi:cysteine-rich repeat protein